MPVNWFRVCHQADGKGQERRGGRRIIQAVAFLLARGRSFFNVAITACDVNEMTMHKSESWQALQNSAYLRKRMGDLKGAIANLEDAIRLTRAVPNLDNETAEMLNYLGALNHGENAAEQEEQAFRDAVALSRPMNHMNLGIYLSNLGRCLAEKRHREEAVALLKEALELHRRQGRFWDAEQVEKLIKAIETCGPGQKGDAESSG
jgi:tetratricopeptide (TPR) repeat protein